MRLWLSLSYYPSIYADGLRKLTKYLSRYSQSLCRDLDPVPPEYEVEILTSQLQSYVVN
jgi:hypothetical protein